MLMKTQLCSSDWRLHLVYVFFLARELFVYN